MSNFNVRGRMSLRGDDFRRGLNRSRSDFSRFSADVSRHARRIAVALAATATAAGVIGASFEQSMANIGAVSNATQADMARLEKRARQLGATTSYSATQVADAMTVLAKKGLEVGENISSVEAVLKLAGSEMADMTESAELLTASMRQFNIPFAESARVANTLAAAAQQSGLSVDKLLVSLANAGAIANETGISFEETVAALGILVDAGIDASKAGTQVRSALVDIIKGGGDLEEALDGVTTRSDGLIGVLQALAAAGIQGEESFRQFNVRGANAISILQRNRERLVELTKGITGTSAAWTAYNRQQDTTIGAAKRVVSALQEQALALFKIYGKDLKDRLDDLATWINENSVTIQTWAVEHKKAVAQAVAALGFYVDYWGIVLEGLTSKITKWAEIARLVLPDFVNFLIDDLKQKAAELADAGLIDQEALAASAVEFAKRLVEIEKEYQEALGRIMDINAPETREERFAALGEELTKRKEIIAKFSSDLGPRLKEGLPEPEKVVGPMAEELYDVTESVVQVWRSTFSAITDLGSSAADKWRAIWTGVFNTIRNAFSNLIENMIAESDFGKQLGKKVFGFLSSFLPIPGFATGGHVPTDTVAQIHRDEFVVRPEVARIHRRDLEALNRGGSLPSSAARISSGVSIGELRISVPVSVPRGSLVMADDPIALRRWSRKIGDEIERSVRQTFRDLQPVAPS